jgi:hypothetical protein
MSDKFYLLKLHVWLTSALSSWRLRWALNTSVYFGVWMQNENVSRRVGFNRWRHVTKNRSTSHRSAVTFDTVCLILSVSCVLSFRLSLRLCFPSVSNFYFTSQYNQFPLSHASAAAAAAIHTYPRAAAAATITPSISLKFHPKHEKCK